MKMRRSNENSKKNDVKLKAQIRKKRPASLGYQGDKKTEEEENFAKEPEQ